ncbi:MAG: LysR family transcriptional regulator, partial [Oscillospiraceae bacterium]|nr:LysR family transcriptional regulator [Oscillospiraceae bacterium]
MELSLAKCEILMEVVESRSLTSASQRLGITQSAVSHSIS